MGMISDVEVASLRVIQAAITYRKRTEAEGESLFSIMDTHGARLDLFNAVDYYVKTTGTEIAMLPSIHNIKNYKEGD